MNLRQQRNNPTRSLTTLKKMLVSRINITQKIWFGIWTAIIEKYNLTCVLWFPVPHRFSLYSTMIRKILNTHWEQCTTHLNDKTSHPDACSVSGNVSESTGSITTFEPWVPTCLSTSNADHARCKNSILRAGLNIFALNNYLIAKSTPVVDLSQGPLPQRAWLKIRVWHHLWDWQLVIEERNYVHTWGGDAPKRHIRELVRPPQPHDNAVNARCWIDIWVKFSGILLWRLKWDITVKSMIVIK